MKLNTIILSGFLLLILLIGGFGFFITSQLGQISEISYEVEEANEIAQAALDFNVENFHTQLKVLEYAYGPTTERLTAFEGNNKVLTQSLTELQEKVEEEALDQPEEEIAKGIHALHPGGFEAVEVIAANLKLVRDDWVGLFRAISNLEEAKAEGLKEGDTEYEALEAIVAQKVFSNEALFDNLEFNKQVGDFVYHQGELIQTLSEKERELLSGFNTILYVLLSLIVLLGIGIAFFVSRMISQPLAKLTSDVDEITKGNLDIRLQGSNIDEVGSLTNSLSRILASMKLAILKTGALHKPDNDLRKERAVKKNIRRIQSKMLDKKKVQSSKIKKSVVKTKQRMKSKKPVVKRNENLKKGKKKSAPFLSKNAPKPSKKRKKK